MSDGPVDVFISFKSEDEAHARVVYDALRAAGRRVFFSRESLPLLGSDEYHKQIDLAIERATHMVVVTSSGANLSSRWVDYEWRLFLGELLARRKTGNLITLLAADVAMTEIPLGLRHREVVRLNSAGLTSLLGYTRVGDAQPPPEAPAARRDFRLAATIGGPPSTALMRASRGTGLIVTGGVDGALRVYDRRSGTRRAMLGSRKYFRARHEALVTALAFSHDDRYLASGHLDGAVHVWDLQDEREIGDLAHAMAIGGVAFTPDNRTLISGSRDGVVRYWDLASLGEERPKPSGAAVKPVPVVFMAVLPAPSWVVIGLVNTVTGRHSLQVEKATQVERVIATLNLAAPFKHVDIAANGSVLAAAGNDGIVRVYDWHAAADQIARKQNPRLLPLMTEFTAHRTPPTGLAVFPDGARVATCAADAIRVWDIATGEKRIQLQAEGGAQFIALAIVDEGRALIAALQSGRIQVFDAV